MVDLYSTLCYIRSDSKKLAEEIKSQKIDNITDDSSNIIDLCNMIDRLAEVCQNIANQVGAE